jgi:NAD(P)H-dependent flavin oxidoreductase YrpB (nitropropane dioxygenase family)
MRCLKLAGAIALGAAGVNMGTAFMVTEEAEIHQNIKDAMIKADERNTIHIFRTLKNTARVYKNDVAMEVVKIENRPGGCEFKDIAHVRIQICQQPIYLLGLNLTSPNVNSSSSLVHEGKRFMRKGM